MKIEGELAGGIVIGRTAGGRRVVLKRLERDCLLEGELHPSIRLRLQRVRELPVKQVANLHGVERIDHNVFAVWDYVPGETLEAAAAKSGGDEVVRWLRETDLIVAAMHSAGIVHGAIHERNVIIEGGAVHLTHVSPLLLSDPQLDLVALQQMRGRVLKKIDAIFVDSFPAAIEAEPTVRRRMILAAVLAASVGAAIFFGVRRHVAENDEPYMPLSGANPP